MSTKCWLRSRAEPTAGNIYAEWARAHNETYYKDGLKRLLAMFPESARAIDPPISQYFKDATWRFAIDVRLRTNDLDSRLQAVERLPSEGRGRPVQFIPYRFEFANKLTKNDKLSLAFDALVLSEAVGREVSLGKIMHGDGYATRKVKLPSLTSQVRKTDQGHHRTFGRRFAARPCAEPALWPVRIPGALPSARDGEGRAQPAFRHVGEGA